MKHITFVGVKIVKKLYKIAKIYNTISFIISVS